jgi:D-glycero-alpha-D-manno-heptose-7-phosphate kinase
LTGYGRVIVQNNECQRSLHPGFISEEADAVIEIAKKYNVSGWKVNGAGGKGGSLTILGSRKLHYRAAMLKEIGKLGKDIRSLHFSLSTSGLTVTNE